MAKELERKFLLAENAKLPKISLCQRYNIKQGYIHAEKGKQVRIRLYSDKAVIGIKYTSNLLRDEFEYPIPLKDGKAIYDKCAWRLEKRRLSFNLNKYHYDVDTFPNGMKWVEVEFKNQKAMDKWVKPDWLGEEITSVSKYSNVTLAKKNLTFK